MKEEKESFVKKGIKINLKGMIPTPLTPELLQAQLYTLGLNCDHTSTENLAKYTEEVKRELLDGNIQVYSIKMRKEGIAVSSIEDDHMLVGENYHENSITDAFVEAAVGNWMPVDSTGTGYDRKLQTIINAKHFAELNARKFPIFGGIQGVPRKTERKLATVEAVKGMFKETAYAAASVLVDGLNKDALEATMSNAIAPPDVMPTKVDYVNNHDRVLLLVKNYDPVKRESDAIGAMNISWQLFISHVTDKKEVEHRTTTDVVARVVLYDSVEDLEEDYNYIEKLNPKKAQMPFPIRDKDVKVYENLPVANGTVYDDAIPLTDATDKCIARLVLYAPNLISAGCLDNTDANAETTFSKAITNGFNFSTSQKLTAGLEFAVGIVFAKAAFKTSFEITFTEAWNHSETQTVTFKAPAKEKVFLYQGTINYRKILYFPETLTFKWSDEPAGVLSTNVAKTSRVPLMGNITDFSNVPIN
ncbi:MAG: hypothetical protein QE487_08720 [Fluviicola sp.]|nr:hypothetical protein [Fluviicola sp.]